MPGQLSNFGKQHVDDTSANPLTYYTAAIQAALQMFSSAMLMTGYAYMRACHCTVSS